MELLHQNDELQENSMENLASNTLKKLKQLEVQTTNTKEKLRRRQLTLAAQLVLAWRQQVSPHLCYPVIV